jgi:hypothetical protein
MLGGCGGGAACAPGFSLTAYADPVKGNNATGVVGDQCFPFLTLQAAHNALPANGGVIRMAPGAFPGAVVLTKVVKFIGSGGGLGENGNPDNDVTTIQGVVNIAASPRAEFEQMQIQSVISPTLVGALINYVSFDNVEVGDITLDRVSALRIVDFRCLGLFSMTRVAFAQAYDSQLRGSCDFATIGRFEFYSTDLAVGGAGTVTLSYDANDPEAPPRAGLFLLAATYVSGPYDEVQGVPLTLSGHPILFIDEDSMVSQIQSGGLTTGPNGEVLAITCHGQLGKIAGNGGISLLDIPSSNAVVLNFAETTFAGPLDFTQAAPVAVRIRVIAHDARFEDGVATHCHLGASVDMDARNAHFVGIINAMFAGSDPTCGLDRDFHMSDVDVTGAVGPIPIIIDPPLPPYAVAPPNQYSVTALATASTTQSVPFLALGSKLAGSFAIVFVPALPALETVHLDLTFKRTDRHLPPPV